MPESLSAINEKIHCQLEEGWQNFLISLTALELEKASEQLGAFTRLQERHMDAEEKHLHPVYEALEPKDSIL